MFDVINIEMLMPWIIAAVIILIGTIAIRILDKIVLRMLRKTSLDSGLYKFISHGITAVCWIVLVGTALSYAGVPISTFITVMGVAGAAIALSLRDSLGSIVGGIIIMISKPFKKGDLLEVNQVIGIVDQIDLLFTKLLTLDNRVIFIPNGNLSNSVMINYSAEETRRVDCRFGISGKSSISEAKEILSAIPGQSDMILKEPEPVIGIAEQSSWIVFIDFRVWCLTADVRDVRYFLEENVKIAFDEAGIEMPVPHMNIHVNN